MKSKVASYILIIASFYYIVAEAITAIYFNSTFLNAYLFHPISELGIPNANSPLHMLMNSAFILIGLALIFVNFSKLKDDIVKNQTIFYILTLITGMGVIIVGLIHGGNPAVASYHGLGATMAMVGGNILLIVTSKSMDEFKSYQKATLTLGIIGLVSFFVMLSLFTNPSLMPIFERLSVYPLILWSIMTGICMFKCGNENIPY